MSLHPDHLADLKSSGLSDEIIAVMQVYSLPPMQIPEYGGGNTAIESALAFPYFDADGNRNGFMRVKVFPPQKSKDGHTIKYLQKKDTPAHLYILPSVIAALCDPAIKLYIVEGEKKTARAVDAGLTAIGIGGLWNWVQKNTYDAIPDFDSINWWRREAVIVPDSDTWEKKELCHAVFALGREIKQRGAAVKMARMARMARMEP